MAPENRKYWIIAIIGLLTANIVLQILDVWTTTVVLAAGGVEDNQVSRWIMENLSMAFWIAIKIGLMLGLVGAIIWSLRAELPEIRKATFASLAIAIWMGGVVIGNFFVMGTI